MTFITFKMATVCDLVKTNRRIEFILCCDFQAIRTNLKKLKLFKDSMAIILSKS